MNFSQHSLHASFIEADSHKEQIRGQVEVIIKKQVNQIQQAPAAAPTSDSIAIPLTTVSLNSNFDAFINIQFKGSTSSSPTSLLVDSGNSMLIVPYYEEIEGLPGYTVLGTAKEPWGSPANVVKGPIEVPTASGEIYTLEDCVFYACTGGARTANFGAGCITPWSASGWNTPISGVVMQSPLSYNTEYPFAEFDYAPAETVITNENNPAVAEGSHLMLYRSQPSGYTMLDIIPNLEWMSLIPNSLTIGDKVTGWPGTVSSPIAMVDTGGGPVFLSDPNGYVYTSSWPDPVDCPGWASSSEDCECISDAITLSLENTEKSAAYQYTINTANLPKSVQGLTLVICKVNRFMMGQQGMNIGGISALFNMILIDYANNMVGLKSK